VEDRQLWRKYFEKKRDVENSRLNGSSGANELKLLWHGTGQNNPEVTTGARNGRVFLRALLARL
jgi:hypothetical protein